MVMRGRRRRIKSTVSNYLFHSHIVSCFGFRVNEKRITGGQVSVWFIHSTPSPPALLLPICNFAHLMYSLDCQRPWPMEEAEDERLLLLFGRRIKWTAGIEFFYLTLSHCWMSYFSLVGGISSPLITLEPNILWSQTVRERKGNEKRMENLMNKSRRLKNVSLLPLQALTWRSEEEGQRGFWEE